MDVVPAFSTVQSEAVVKQSEVKSVRFFSQLLKLAKKTRAVEELHASCREDLVDIDVHHLLQSFDSPDVLRTQVLRVCEDVRCPH